MRGPLVRAVATLCALGWLIFPGFGLIDLSVTWSSDWPRVLEAGWGLFFTVLVGVAFGLVAIRPRSSAPAITQLFVAAAALALSAVATSEPRLLALSFLVAIETALVAWLARPPRLHGGEPRPRPSAALLILACLGVIPWVVYAIRMYALDRDGAMIDDTLGIDHYAVQGALGIAFAALALAVALWPGQGRFPAVCVGGAAAYLGVVSLASPGAVAGWSPTLSAAAIAWGAALAVVASRPWSGLRRLGFV